MHLLHNSCIFVYTIKQFITMLTHEEIKRRKRQGDLETAGRLMAPPVNGAYASLLLRRKGAKRYSELIEIISKVIEHRESLELNQTNLAV